MTSRARALVILAILCALPFLIASAIAAMTGRRT